MPLFDSPYSMGAELTKRGFEAVLDPYEKACGGATVFVIVRVLADIGMAQRSFYQKVLDNKTPVKGVRNSVIQFRSGGQLRFITPSTPPVVFEARDKTKTFYYIYRG